jgi:hypothetical protein
MDDTTGRVSEAEPRELTKLKDVWVLQDNTKRWPDEMDELLILTKDEAEALAAWRQAEGEDVLFRATPLTHWITEWVSEESYSGRRHYDETGWSLRAHIRELRWELHDRKILNRIWMLAAAGGWLVAFFTRGL